MNIRNSLNYIRIHYPVTTNDLIYLENILKFIDKKASNKKQSFSMLVFLTQNAINLSELEVRKILFTEMDAKTVSDLERAVPIPIDRIPSLENRIIAYTRMLGAPLNEIISKYNIAVYDVGTQFWDGKTYIGIELPMPLDPSFRISFDVQNYSKKEFVKGLRRFAKLYDAEKNAKLFFNRFNLLGEAKSHEEVLIGCNYIKDKLMDISSELNAAYKQEVKNNKT